MTDASSGFTGDSLSSIFGPASPDPRSDPFLPDSPELPPEMEGFQLYNQIGSGSTGTVYRTIQTREFAVKVVRWCPESMRETARREYDTAALFADCETTVHAFACYEHDSCSFILQEIGEPIADHFFRQPCSLRTLLEALLDVSDALRLIHARGYSHFDVKPGNILAVKGRARLGDFSHCLRYVPGQQYERRMGTEVYMAPEITPGAVHSGLEDMYSLGVTMYTLLTGGVAPFGGKKGEDLYNEKKQPIRSLFIHPGLLSVIRKAAAFDPAERYRTFEEFSDDIRSFMEKNSDGLDEMVPAYLSADLRRPTVPPFFDGRTARTDLS